MSFSTLIVGKSSKCNLGGFTTHLELNPCYESAETIDPLEPSPNKQHHKCKIQDFNPSHKYDRVLFDTSVVQHIIQGNEVIDVLTNILNPYGSVSFNTQEFYANISPFKMVGNIKVFSVCYADLFGLIKKDPRFLIVDDSVEPIYLEPSDEKLKKLYAKTGTFTSLMYIPTINHL